jgi:hypothetical protein
MAHTRHYNPLLGKPRYDGCMGLKRSHPLNKGLVAWWLMNEGAGQLQDILGRYPTTGTWGTGASWAKSAKGFATKHAWEFGGIPLGTLTLLFGSNFSISFWVYSTMDGATYGKSVFGASNNTNAFQIAIGAVSTNTNCVYTLATSNDYPLMTSSNTLTANAWHHVVYVRSGTGTANNRCWIDGVEVLNNANSSATYLSTARPYFIGAPDASSYTSFVGYLSGMTIWSRLLTSAEAVMDFVNPYGTPSNPRFLWSAPRTWSIPAGAGPSFKPYWGRNSNSLLYSGMST